MVVLPWPELSKTRPNTALEHAITLKRAMDMLLSHAEANKRKTLPIAMFKELVESFTELHDKWTILPLPAADLLDSLRRIEAEARDLKTATAVTNDQVQGLARTRGLTAPVADTRRPPRSMSHNFGGDASKCLTLIVKVNEQAVIKLFRGLDSVARLKMINDAITVDSSIQGPVTLSAEHLAGQTRTMIQAEAAMQLKSGDMELCFPEQEHVELLRHATTWLGIFGEGARVVTTTYGFMVHTVHTGSMNLNTEEKKQEVIHQLWASNHLRMPHWKTITDIKYIGWLVRYSPSKRVSSVVIEMATPQQANDAITFRVDWNAERHTCSVYDRDAKIKQCFTCWSYGHIGSQCTAPHPLCGNCTSTCHDQKKCPDPDKNRKCANCARPHSSWSSRCPKRIEEQEKARIVADHRPALWPVPATIPRDALNKAINTPSFTNISLADSFLSTMEVPYPQHRQLPLQRITSDTPSSSESDFISTALTTPPKERRTVISPRKRLGIDHALWSEQICAPIGSCSSPTELSTATLAAVLPAFADTISDRVSATFAALLQGYSTTLQTVPEKDPKTSKAKYISTNPRKRQIQISSEDSSTPSAIERPNGKRVVRPTAKAYGAQPAKRRKTGVGAQTTAFTHNSIRDVNKQTVNNAVDRAGHSQSALPSPNTSDHAADQSSSLESFEPRSPPDTIPSTLPSPRTKTQRAKKFLALKGKPPLCQQKRSMSTRDYHTLRITRSGTK